jgi:putative transport protein
MDHKILEVFQELGLIFFLIGAGVPGGASFVKYFHPLYFVFGVIITIVPMIIGYIIEKKIIKLSLLDSLGAITGGMTSTPALGSLIKSAGTNDVASSYASTYPIALICVVLGAQLIILIFGG